METQPIVVGIEGEGASSGAIRLGVTLARARSAPLILAGVHVILLAPGSHGYEDVMRDETEADVAAARALVPRDVRVSTRVVSSTSAVRGLHHLAEEVGAGILVLGPTHLSTSAHPVRGDVTLGMLHAAPCAIAIAPEEEPGKRHGRIGVAYIATPEGREALEHAVDLAGRLGTRLRIINVAVDPLLLFSEAGIPDGLLEAIREESAEALEEARAAAGDVPIETVRMTGPTAQQLIAATRELDLLVMGSRGYGPTRRVLLGSVSAHVVHQASCPVLVLPRGIRLRAVVG